MEVKEKLARNLFGFFSGLIAGIIAFVITDHNAFWIDFFEWFMIYGYGVIFYATLTAINKYYGK